MWPLLAALLLVGLLAESLLAWRFRPPLGGTNMNELLRWLAAWRGIEPEREPNCS